MSEPGPAPTDSPWLWLAIFLVGALVSLVLVAPKYAHRQPELEREFLARQRGGQTVPRRDTPSGEVGRPMLSLRPLMLACVVALLTLSCLFWLTRWFQRR
ncbi:MAG: hypothetical protein AAGF97_19045 [Planctomycetota bacterium]